MRDKIQAKATLDIAKFYNKTQEGKGEAKVIGKNITATRKVEKFIIQSGTLDFKTLSIQDSPLAARNLENHGTINLDTFLLHCNKFSNYGDMTIGFLVGH